MKYAIASAALLATVVSADNGCWQDSIGNWYCQEVTAISYTNVGPSYNMSYNRVTAMPQDAACASVPVNYTGPISPLNEEVSLHFRGPLALKQFAFYTPGSSGNTKRQTNERRRAHGHGHAHLHRKREASPEEEEKRGLGSWVTAVMNGATVSWQNNYSGQATAAPVANGDDWVTAVINGATVSWKNNWAGQGTAVPTVPAHVAAAAATSAPAAAPAASSAAASVNAASAAASWGSDGTPSGGWTRQAYYDAASGTAEGLVFLNHNGGQGSGTFDYTYGNSLSYATADGSAGCASPNVLEDITLTSSDEIVIMSDKKCSGQNGDCGYYRDGTVAYHGFGGANKAFYFEFGMPNDGQYAAGTNMPAIWLLNAQIPRTVQYGPAACSCWTTGCGEFDIFEVLDPGDGKCKSTLHSNIKGGDSNYFARPFVGTMKAVLIMTDNDFHIKVLDGSSAFGADLIENTLSTIISDTMSAIAGVSLFPLSS